MALFHAWGPRAGGRGRPVLEALAVAAGVAVLALPLVGVQTTPRPSGVTSVAFRLDLVAYCAAAAFAGRLALTAGLGAARRGARRWQRTAALAPNGPVAWWKGAAGPAALGAAVILPFLPGADGYWIDLATTILIYVMLGWGLNIVVGLAGLLDLGYVAFYAVGAYTVGLLTTGLGLGFWECLPIAGLLAAAFGIVLGFPVLRLRGDYLAIVTLRFGEIIRLVLLNWQDLTGGPNGVIGIPGPSFFGSPFSAVSNDGSMPFHLLVGIRFDPVQKTVFLYFLILFLAVLTNLFTLRLRRLPVGRAWEAIREDETACRALGINATNVKLSAFAIGAMFAGLAGSFFATRQGFISPESFTFAESATILAIVVLGGMGSQSGVVVAAMLLVGVPELGRQFAEYRMLLFGAAMVAIMVWRPGGLVAFRRPSLGFGQGRAILSPPASIPSPAQPAPADGPLLTVEGLTMRFGGLVAVESLSFTARTGEITAIIGPNGAGKTTVFNCITGFYRPSGGRITATHSGQGWQLERLGAGQIAARAHVTRTFQNIRLFQGMTAAENLIVAQHGPLMRASRFSVAGLLGMPGYRRAVTDAAELARYWLSLVGLEAQADSLAGQLSYGAQRRLEIARAMCTCPALLCLDEPAAGLNPRESAELNALLAIIRDRHRIGILLIEHDMSVVMRISDHVIVLDQGRKISEGAPDVVRNDPVVIKAYLGSDIEAASPRDLAVGATT